MSKKQNVNRINHLQAAIAEELSIMENDTYPELISECRDKIKDAGFIDRDMQDNILAMVLVQETTGELFEGRSCVDEEIFLALMDSALKLLLEQEDMDAEDDPVEPEEDMQFRIYQEAFKTPDSLSEVLLRDYDRTDIEDLAGELGLPLEGNYEQTAISIAEKLLDPEMLKENFSVLHDHAVDQLTKLAEGKSLTDSDYNDGDYDISHECSLFMEYGWIDENDNFRITDDVREAFASLDTQEFNDRREQLTWLYDCMIAFTDYYASGPVSLLLELYNCGTVWHLDSEKELKALMKKLPKSRRILRLVKGELYNTGLKKVKGFFEKLREDQKDFEFIRPTARQIQALGRYGYPADNPCYRALKEAAQACAADPGMIHLFMESVFQSATTHLDQEEFLEMMNDFEIEPANQEEFQEIVVLMVLVNNHTPKLYMRGLTPAELKKKGKTAYGYIEPAAATARGKENLDLLLKKYAYLEEEICEEEDHGTKS